MIQLEKALELIDPLDHNKTFCLCLFLGGGGAEGEKKSIYQRGEDVFVFKVNTYQIQYIPSIVVTKRHGVVIAAEPNVVNISTCNYNWKGLNESAFPAHLYLFSKLVLYISRPFSKFHSRPFTRSVYR